METYKRSQNPMFLFGMRAITLVAVLSVTFSVVREGHATPIVYTDEASYLLAVDSYGYDKIFEGFEGSDWEVTRPDGIFGSLTTQGITWSASEKLRTGSGWARTGSYGVFDSIGDPDEIMILTSNVPFYGVGGYFETSTAETINFKIANQVVATRVLGTSSNHEFLGIIDPGGFPSVAFTTSSGQWGADDFTIAVPEPVTVVLFGLGSLLLIRRRLR